MNTKKKKVLLVVPPVTLSKDRSNFNINFPMGLGYIAAILERASYEVIVLDAVAEKYDQQNPAQDNPDFIQVGMTFDEIREFTVKCCPDFVGISSMFTIQASNVYRLAAVIKSVDSNIPVILGGSHATGMPNEVLKDKNADFIVLGEGENVILSLLSAIENKEDLNELESIAFRNSNGEIIIKPKTKYLEINSLPFPARHLFPMEKYFATRTRHGVVAEQDDKFRSTAILTSRGCPFHCNFCFSYQMFGRKYRDRTAESVLSEIDELVKTYKITDLYLNDDQFLANRKGALEILNGIIAKDYNITLDAPNGISPWMLNEEIIQKMKLSGFRRICLAIESGNQWVLDNLINKPVKVNKLAEKVKLLNKYKLDSSAFLVVGNIGKKGVETFSQMKDSFDLIRNIGITSVNISYLTPHSGTEALKTIQSLGCQIDDVTEFIYNKPHFSTPEWSKKELEEFVTIEYKIFIRSSQFIFWFLRIFVRSFGDFFLKERYSLLYKLFLLYQKRRLVTSIFRKESC